ncbi:MULTISPECIES: EscU/YscU/HrcU family type III secretion system export apparatus switch protein [unclassified Sporolactobacillus]|uniref:EscU/YscU/HrcU family type III secretion system export apparatus switch protein n=1 Tax=unclassified Sporolactobacillus TaxID=2628533 RepID=UPI00236763AD|nr:EscU/YscU/HrcU family type III secretion system export apparatus switch protein [Sporolactobacillus sp. CQH2019]MDD9147079.1 EscU/YscU/HrcU family type III secretion system export apparatus switch protein [Sporolactobacillus sp. CQH2019]
MTEPAPKKKKQAVALNYEHGKDEVPYVSAKGEGELAKKIIAKAKEYNIPIQEDAALVSMLSELNLNEIIPAELYGAVAEIFAFLYQMDEQSKPKKN